MNYLAVKPHTLSPGFLARPIALRTFPAPSFVFTKSLCFHAELLLKEIATYLRTLIKLAKLISNCKLAVIKTVFLVTGCFALALLAELLLVVN